MAIRFGAARRSGDRSATSSTWFTCSVVLLMCPSVGFLAQFGDRVAKSARSNRLVKASGDVSSPLGLSYRMRARGNRRARLQQCCLCNGASRKILIERGEAGSEASSRRLIGLADLVRTDRRQLVVDERAGIFGIGRIVRKRRLVRPFDEARQRLLRASKTRRRTVACEARVRRHVRIRERRQIAIDVVREREKAAGDSPFSSTPNRTRLRGGLTVKKRISERERVSREGIRAAELDVEEIGVEQHGVERLADLQRGANATSDWTRNGLPLASTGRSISALSPQKQNTPSLLAADETNTNGKRLAEREDDCRSMFRVGIAPQRPALPAVDVRRREVEQRHEPGLHDDTRVQERRLRTREIPPRRREPFIHRHAERADACGCANRERIDLRCWQKPARQRWIDRSAPLDRAERGFR